MTAQPIRPYIDRSGPTDRLASIPTKLFIRARDYAHEGLDRSMDRARAWGWDTVQVDGGHTIMAHAGNYQSYGVEGYATGPLTDTLSIRLAGKVDLSEKGWQRSVTRPADRLGKKNQMAGRASLLWEPDPRFKAFLSISYWRDRSDTQAPQSIAYSPQVPPFSQAARAQPSVIAEPQNSRDADWNSTNYQTTPGLIRPSYEADGRFFGASLRLDYKFGDWATLTSLTGYNDAKRDDVTSVDGLAIEVLTARNSGRIKSFSQELRLSGDAPRLHWLIGGYYSNDDLYEKTLSYFGLCCKDWRQSEVGCRSAPIRRLLRNGG